MGSRSTSRDWLAALEAGCERQFSVTGERDRGMRPKSDNGCQTTSCAFETGCRALGIEQAFTSYNRPRGNADTELSIRTLKEELLSLDEWDDEHHLRGELDRWIDNFNTSYLHSALRYRSPTVFEQQYHRDPETHLMPLDSWGAVHEPGEGPRADRWRHLCEEDGSKPEYCAIDFANLGEGI